MREARRVGPPMAPWPIAGMVGGGGDPGATRPAVVGTMVAAG
jgi:hypothetical protein